MEDRLLWRGIRFAQPRHLFVEARKPPNSGFGTWRFCGGPKAPSTSFPKLRTYRSEREIEFVAPAMDDRVAIEITDEFDDALLQFVCRVDTDVAEH